MDHLGSKIKEVFETRDLTATELAKRINTTRENLYSIFKRSTIDTFQLARICEVLDYNFFLHVIPEKFLQEMTSEKQKLEETLLSYEREINYLKTINNLQDQLHKKKE